MLRQLAFGRQLITGPQDTLNNQILDLIDDRFRDLGVFNFLKYHPNSGPSIGGFLFCPSNPLLKLKRNLSPAARHRSNARINV